MSRNEYSVGLNQCDGCKTSMTEEETFDRGNSEEVWCEKCILQGEHI